jgi:pentatricopeptide repeat protein
MQDHITESVIGLVEPQITQAEIERSRRKRPESLDAYDHFLRGLALLPSGHLEGYCEGVALLDRAVELDPTFPQALAFAGWMHELRQSFGGVAPPGVDDYAVSIALCERALAVGVNDALVLAIAGLQFDALKNDGEGGLALIERALTLNPNSHLVVSLAGQTHFQRSHFDQAIEFYQRALRLSPNSPHNYWPMASIARAHLCCGRFDEAVTWATRSLNTQIHWDFTYVTLIAGYAELGRMDEARSTLNQFLHRRPGVTIKLLINRLPPAMRGTERYWAEGVRRAGLPEA